MMEKYEFSGVALKAARIKARMTQPELGRAMGVSRHTVRRWEIGRLKPHVQTIERLKDTLRRLDSPAFHFLYSPITAEYCGVTVLEDKPAFPVKERAATRATTALGARLEKSLGDAETTPKKVPAPVVSVTPRTARPAAWGEVVLKVCGLAKELPRFLVLFNEREKFSQRHAIGLSDDDYDLYSATHAVLLAAENLVVAKRRYEKERGRWFARNNKPGV